jgi:hypothetical protein
MYKLTLVLALTLGASTARADNGFFYLGAGAARDSLHDVAPRGVSLGNIDTTSWKVLAGVRPVRPLAFEVEYMNLGSQGFTFPDFSARASYEAYAAYAVGFLPIPLPFLDVFGKAGLARWSASGSQQGFIIPQAPLSLSDSGTEFAWGVGTQAHFGNLCARLEYESFRIPSTSGANVVSLSVFLNLY